MPRLMPTRRVRIVVTVVELLLEFALLLGRFGSVLRRGGRVAGLFHAGESPNSHPAKPDLTLT